MSVIADRTYKGWGDPVLAFIRKALRRIAKFIVAVSDAIAESRMQRAALEAELYHGHYRHSSKNDDDLPVVH